MAAFAIFCRVLLVVLNAAALPHRRLLLPLRRRGRLLRDDAAILMVLGASAIFHAVTAGPNDDDDASHVLAAGFLTWVAGVALLLLALTPGRFPGSAAAPARLAAQLVQAAAGALFHSFKSPAIAAAIAF
jgi:hypothetical protein